MCTRVCTIDKARPGQMGANRYVCAMTLVLDATPAKKGNISQIIKPYHINQPVIKSYLIK